MLRAETPAGAADPVVASGEAPASSLRAVVPPALTVTSNVIFLSAFAWMIVVRGEQLQNFAVSLGIIALAGTGYAIAAFVNPGATWSGVMIPLIVAVTFAMFSALIHIVT